MKKLAVKVGDKVKLVRKDAQGNEIEKDAVVTEITATGVFVRYTSAAGKPVGASFIAGSHELRT